MAIDTSMYGRMQAPDIMGGVQQGLALREMVDQRNLRQKKLREEEAERKAYAAGITTGPDGGITINEGVTLSELAKVDPIKAYQAKRQFSQDRAADQKRQYETLTQRADYFSRNLPAFQNAKDPATKAQLYQKMYSEAQDLGFDVSGFPQTYTPGIEDVLNLEAGRVWSAKDRADQEWKAKNYDLQKQKFAHQRQKDKGVGGLKLTKGEESVDKAFAKDYNDFVSQGGYADVQKNLNQLREVKRALENTDSATGPLVGLLPKSVRDVLTPEGAALQDKIEEVVQRNLRLVLGAQFTEKESQRLIERAYNPRLSEEENARRVGALIEQIEAAAIAKTAAAKYYEDHGTLKGFEGVALQNQFPNQSTTQISEVERKTKDGRIAVFDANTKQFLRYK